MNTVALMGRLTFDPELKYTTNGISVVRFQIAVNRKFQKDKADFIDVTAWRQTAEFIANHFLKGSMIAIEGSIQTDSFTDKDGNKRKSVQVIANNVFFCGSKEETTSPVFQKPNQSNAVSDHGDFEEIVDYDDDLPF